MNEEKLKNLANKTITVWQIDKIDESDNAFREYDENKFSWGEYHMVLRDTTLKIGGFKFKQLF